jgi:hypothetical protein
VLTFSRKGEAQGPGADLPALFYSRMVDEWYFYGEKLENVVEEEGLEKQTSWMSWVLFV